MHRLRGDFMLRIVIEFVLFAASTGVFFSELRKNNLAVLTAGLIAVASTISLFWGFADFFKTPSINASTNPPAPMAPDEVFWLAIKDTASPGFFEEFLRQFPGSKYVPNARQRLAQLKEQAVNKPTKRPTEKICVTFNNRQICE